MADVKHYNNIKIARGTRQKWLDNAEVSYGELFYDKNTEGVYIAVPGADGIELKRFGGFDTIVLKGTVTGTTFEQVCAKAEPGDAYIVTGKISVAQPEIIFDNEGGVTRSATNKRTYDDFFKNGQVIIFTSDDVANIPNSYKMDAANGEGAVGCITLAGTAEATDLEYDGSLTEVANAEVAGGEEVRNVQDALDHLFNDKMEYIGSFTTGNVISTTLTKDDAQPTTDKDTVWALIAKEQKLLMGQSIVYSGDTKKVTLADGSSVTIRTNTMIVNNAGVIHTIPLGASDGKDISVVLTGERKSDEAAPSFESVNADGTKVTLEEIDIATVQHAIDFLHQTKADLNTNGKIPLSQIPTTMIGALQYIGTVEIPAATTKLTTAQLATLLAGNKTGKSWETDENGELIGDSSVLKEAYEDLDSGDYVIIKVANPTIAGTDAGNTLTRQIEVTNENGDVLYKISNGDHVIVNDLEAANEAERFDILDSSAAVDAVNNIMGSVEIIDHERRICDGLNEDGSVSIGDYTETDIVTDRANHTIQVQIPDAVLEPSEISAHNIPVASGTGKSILESDVYINDAGFPSKWHEDPTDGHNTELTGKTKDGDDVTIEFPDESGKLSVTTGEGTKDYLPKYDELGNLIDSTVSQTVDATSKAASINLGDDFHINYEELGKLFQYLKGTDKITRLFDHDSDTINSESATARTHDANIKVVLDEDSAIDGGEWV